MRGVLCKSLAAACERHGAATAIVDGPVQCSYRELLDDAHRLGQALRAAELGPDEPVHVAVSNRASDLAAMLGVWLAGGVVVPVHRTTPHAVAAALRRRTAARWQVDLGIVEGSGAAAAISAIAPRPPPPRPLLEGAAFVIFTSGSTGEPKGVVVGHDAFDGKLRQIDGQLGFDTGDGTLLVLNITFSFGLWVALLTLLRGGRLVMQQRFDGEKFLQALTAERIARVGMVPTMMRVLFADPRHEPAIDALDRQATLRHVLIGGESLGLSLAATIRRRFAATTLVDIYGLTETSTCDFFAFPADFARHPGAIGRPSPGVSHRLVDAAGRPVADGTVGELQIRSPYRMRGYLDDPALTAAAFDDGWLRTGDLAREVGDGVVELMGRSKEVIARGGNKVTPGEIEQAVCALPDVAAAMAVGVPDPLLGERIHLLVVMRAGAVFDPGEMRRHLAPRLERFKQPDVCHVADALPLGRTGKADRGRLKALILDGALAPAPFPTTETREAS